MLPRPILSASKEAVAVLEAVATRLRPVAWICAPASDRGAVAPWRETAGRTTATLIKPMLMFEVSASARLLAVAVRFSAPATTFTWRRER